MWQNRWECPTRRKAKTAVYLCQRSQKTGDNSWAFLENFQEHQRVSFVVIKCKANRNHGSDYAYITDLVESGNQCKVTPDECVLVFEETLQTYWWHSTCEFNLCARFWVLQLCVYKWTRVLKKVKKNIKNLENLIKKKETITCLLPNTSSSTRL